MGGVCCVGSTCQPSTLEECQTIGGDYKSGGGPSGICYITEIIRDYLDDEHKDHAIVGLLAGGTYMLLSEARDQILLKSAIGERFFKLYTEHGGVVLELTRRDRELRRHVLYTFLKLAWLSRNVLHYLWSEDPYFEVGGGYTVALHKELIALMYRLDASGAGEDMLQAFKSILRSIEGLVDLPGAELLKRLGVKSG